MKNLIYQYWDGDLTPGCIAGTKSMKKYANRIGAKYLFEHSPRFVTNLGLYSPHYGSFKPVYDESFHVYDNVLFTDTDVFPVDDLEENVFDNFTADVGSCTEPDQPYLRSITAGRITTEQDEKWAKVVEQKWRVSMPRTSKGLLKVYNSGVVMYSNAGLKAAKEKFVPFREYVNLINSHREVGSFYTSDQSYLHAMLFVSGIKYVELDNGWNSFIHYANTKKSNGPYVNDTRTKNTKFVHIQLSGADHRDEDTHWRITNLPQSEWNL